MEWRHILPRSNGWGCISRTIHVTHGHTIVGYKESSLPLIFSSTKYCIISLHSNTYNILCKSFIEMMAVYTIYCIEIYVGIILRDHTHTPISTNFFNQRISSIAQSFFNKDHFTKEYYNWGYHQQIYMFLIFILISMFFWTFHFWMPGQSPSDWFMVKGSKSSIFNPLVEMFLPQDV